MGWPKCDAKLELFFRTFWLVDHLSVYDNVALPLRVAGNKIPRLNSRTGKGHDTVVELLNWVGLGKHMTAAPDDPVGRTKATRCDRPGHHRASFPVVGR